MENIKNMSIVVLCMDYRIWPKALLLLKEKYGDFDLVSVAGSCKNLNSPDQEGYRETLLENIRTSMRLHNAKKIILTNHLDCGGYGGSKKFASKEEEISFHQNELERAKAFIQKNFPDLLVFTELILMDNGKISLK